MRGLAFTAHVACLLLGASLVAGGVVGLSAAVTASGGALLVVSGVLAFRGGRSVVPARYRAQAELLHADAERDVIERALAKVVGATLVFFGVAALLACAAIAL